MTDANVCCIPYKYSKYGVYSSHLFLVNGIINYFMVSEFYLELRVHCI